MRAERYAAGVLVVLAVAGTACSRKAVALHDQGIAVEASGRATVAWDSFAVTLNEFAIASTKRLATAHADEAIRRTLDAVRAAVPSATTKAGNASERTAPGVSGVRVYERATVRVRGIDAVERVLRVVLELSPSTGCCGWVVAVSPTRSSSLVAAAREDALQDARAQALKLADESGVKIGKPLAISEPTELWPSPRNIGSRPLSMKGLGSFLEAIRSQPATTETKLVMLNVRFAIKR
jgi:uncharacterized protein YggE